MPPTIGRSVHYRVTASDAEKTNARRGDALNNAESMRAERPGFQAHVGNPLAEGDVVSLTVTAVYPDGDLDPATEGINGQAILDGNDSLWVTNVHRGDEPGQWDWPPRAE